MSRQFQPVDWGKFKRSLRRTAIYSGLYFVLTFASVSALSTLHPSGTLAIALALVPAFAAIGLVRAYLLGVRELDEFQRRLQFEAIIIGAAVTAFASVAYGFLEIWAGFPHVSAFYAMLVMVGAFSLATVFLNLRHRP
jgi:hypothetical protein